MKLIPYKEIFSLKDDCEELSIKDRSLIKVKKLHFFSYLFFTLSYYLLVIITILILLLTSWARHSEKVKHIRTEDDGLLFVTFILFSIIAYLLSALSKAKLDHLLTIKTQVDLINKNQKA